MTFSDILSPKRLVSLGRKDLMETLRTALIAAGAVFGVFLLAYVLRIVLGPGGRTLGTVRIGVATGSADFHIAFFPNLLLLGGFIATSRAFHELHNKTRNHDWLMLPASTVEKFLARLLLSSVGYLVAVNALYFLYSAVAAGLTSAIFGARLPLFNPFRRDLLLMGLHYLVLQSLFLLGAAYFRKAHFIKTVLVLGGVGIGLSIIAGLAARLIYAPYFDGWVPAPELENLGQQLEAWLGGPMDIERLGRSLLTTIKVLYWAALAPVCWIITFLRLRETEVRHGV